MKIICIARNYAAHAEELDRQVGGGTPCPPEPAWFLKPDTALLRNNDPFYIPAFSQEVHYECELVVRINRVGKAIAEQMCIRDRPCPRPRGSLFQAPRRGDSSLSFLPSVFNFACKVKNNS